jgi:hypothetical protein
VKDILEKKKALGEAREKTHLQDIKMKSKTKVRNKKTVFTRLRHLRYDLINFKDSLIPHFDAPPEYQKPIREFVRTIKTLEKNGFEVFTIQNTMINRLVANRALSYFKEYSQISNNRLVIWIK